MQRAIDLLVAEQLAPRSRARYAWSLRAAGRWCAANSLRLLDLAPLDIAALAVAMRDSGADPRETLTALSFVFRQKPDPCESATTLARRVDKVWRAQNRHRLTPHRRAPVLPLGCWMAMHAAVGRPGYLDKPHDLNAERLARDKLLISLGVTGGLRPGEPGRLSASASRIDTDRGQLVLPLVVDSPSSVTKSGRSEIVVPLRQAPFDVLPLAEDFERLRSLRLARPEADDHLIAGEWHYAMKGGLSEGQVRQLLRKMAQMAGIEQAAELSGHSMRRSMAHISVAAGWPLEAVAAVLGHASTRELQNTYLEGYCGSWTSGEGRQSLLEGVDGWVGWPINIQTAAEPQTDAMAIPPRWWVGRDLETDRAKAMTLARSTARVAKDAAARTARSARIWEQFCAEARVDPAQPSKGLLRAFAASISKDSTAPRSNDIQFLADHFASLPTTDIGDLPQIAGWVSAAAKLADSITTDNRKKARTAPARRQIQTVTDDTMHRLFAVPLQTPTEATRLAGLVIEQGETRIELTWSQRNAFRFGADTRITLERAELLVPDEAPRQRRAAIWVTPRDGDSLWCGYEAVKTLADLYPHKSLHSKVAAEAWSSRCDALVGWLEARAAVAVLYATGLRPTDLDGFRWSDLAADPDGTIMWRLPYSKGNREGSRVQVLRLHPADERWCAVSALQRLAGSLTAARDAGWDPPAAHLEAEGSDQRVFRPRIAREMTLTLMEPAAVKVRPQDFRYLTASKTWAATGDIQAVKAALFHRRAETSAIYVARGMPPDVRFATDPMRNVYEDCVSSEHPNTE